jgi:hypothetical protein
VPYELPNSALRRAQAIRRSQVSQCVQNQCPSPDSAWTPNAQPLPAASALSYRGTGPLLGRAGKVRDDTERGWVNLATDETGTPRAGPIEPAQQQDNTARPDWPGEDLSIITNAPDFTLRQIIEASPDKIIFKPQARTEYFLSGLFAGADLLRMITSSQARPRTDSLSELWRVAANFPQMLPNPLPSRRDTAVPERRKYIVVRAKNPNQGTLDGYARRIWHLANLNLLPLRMVVFDANRSLEAWYAGDGKTDRDFFAAACQVGADPAAWHLTAPVRTPDSMRMVETQQSYMALKRAGMKELLGLCGLMFPRRQHVFYFDPK